MTQSSLSSSCPLNANDLRLLHGEPITKTVPKDFFQQLRFSPDGLKILASTESGTLKSWEVYQDEVNRNKFYSYSHLQRDDVTGVRNILSESTAVQCGESIYDFQWYPFMNSNEPASCCFITSCRDHPIHLWDSATGNIRCSYSCYNAMDELEAANSVTFNLTGDKIYAGSNRMIRSFDVSYPGENCCCCYCYCYCYCCYSCCYCYYYCYCCYCNCCYCCCCFI